MTLGDRIVLRLNAMGLSQAELARRVGITQPSVNHLIKRGAAGSAHLHKIARELHTTPAYLTGEIDDPDADARDIEVNHRERELLGIFRAMDSDDQNLVLQLAHSLMRNVKSTGTKDQAAR